MPEVQSYFFPPILRLLFHIRLSFYTYGSVSSLLVPLWEQLCVWFLVKPRSTSEGKSIIRRRSYNSFQIPQISKCIWFPLLSLNILWTTFWGPTFCLFAAQRGSVPWFVLAFHFMAYSVCQRQWFIPLPSRSLQRRGRGRGLSRCNRGLCRACCLPQL